MTSCRRLHERLEQLDRLRRCRDLLACGRLPRRRPIATCSSGHDIAPGGRVHRTTLRHAAGREVGQALQRRRALRLKPFPRLCALAGSIGRAIEFGRDARRPDSPSTIISERRPPLAPPMQYGAPGGLGERPDPFGPERVLPVPRPARISRSTSRRAGPAVHGGDRRPIGSSTSAMLPKTLGDMHGLRLDHLWARPSRSALAWLG